MNKLKVLIGIIAVLSVLFGQCMCPYVDDSPYGALGWYSPYYYNDTQIELLDEWTTIDSKWNFKDGGELVIQSQTETTKAYWIARQNTMEIIIKGESTVYNVEPLSVTKLRLTVENKEIVLEK